MSHRFWQQRFQSDPLVLDRPIRLNNAQFVVIGVAEAGFENTSFVGTDLWVDRDGWHGAGRTDS